MNNLTLRTLTSPYINDVTRGSVLSQADVDNNFIFLKGNIVYTAETIGNIVTLKRFNGDDLSFIAGETFTGGTISGATNFIGGLTTNTISATTYYGLPQDIYVTGGTYSSGRTTFTNNLGDTFDVTGYFTGSTVVPSEIVYFDSTNPNISGTTFDPDIQMSADTLYVSSVDANTWVYSGASYVTYSAATVSNTEFNLNGTSVDAGGNKTAHISRSGSITIGGTGQTTDKFSVFTTGGTKSLVAGIDGSVYNRGGGNLQTNTAFGENSLRDNTTGNDNTAYGYNSLINNLSGSSNTAIGNSVLRVNSGSDNTGVGRRSLYLNTTGANNTSIGSSSLRLMISGSSNTAVGVNSLYNNTASENIAIGVNTSLNNTTGSFNSSLGNAALRNNTTGSYNIALGQSALQLSTVNNHNIGIGYLGNYGLISGSGNIGIGTNALGTSYTGSSNVAIGYQTLRLMTNASFNTAVGYQTLYSNVSGGSNTALGYESAYYTTGGSNNVSVGFRSLYFNTTGANNTATGFNSLLSNTSGDNNAAIGLEALRNNTTGSNNIGIGSGAGNNNTTGSNNTTIGHQSQYFNLSGSNLTSIGYRALRSNTTGVSNTALGTESLVNNTTGSDNTATGYQSLLSNTTGNYNTALGRSALYTNTSGNYNIAMGFQALYLNLSGNSNTAIGASVLNSNSTGSNNIGIGTNALKLSTTASNNIGIGINTLTNSTTGTSNIGIGTSSQQLLTIGISNVSIGVNSSLSNVTGGANVAIGQDSLYNNTSSNNTAIGYRSGYNLINGTSNTIIGANSVVPSGLTASLVLSDGNGVVKLSADSTHRLFIPTSPSTGTTSDSLLVRTSGGEIKQLAVSSISSSFGAFGISSSAGTYTYYSTLTLAMSAATAGDTIEVFADYTESVSGTTVLIKPNVVVQGNGHTYKHTATGDTDTFSFGTNDDHFIYNYNIIRTNATGGYVFNRVPYVPYNVYCNGTTVKTNQNGILFHFSQPGNVYNLTLISTGGGIGVQGSGSNFNNCLFIGTSTSTNSLASAGSVLNNCSVINRGSGISIGDCYLNSTSVISYSSAAASGTYGVRNSFIYSSTSYGLLPFNGGIVENTVIQSAGSYAAYIYNSNCRFDNCKLISSVNNAFYAGLGIDAKLNNCVLVSSAAIALNAHSVEVTNSTIESTWNNASGHAVAVVSNDTVITNCMLRVANSSANAIYGSSAFSPKFANNVYANMTTPINANITQGIINTQDNQGNILI